MTRSWKGYFLLAVVALSTVADVFKFAQARAKEERSFNAHTERLMQFLNSSVYHDKDIFLRELLSNAADALDKMRHASLKDRSLLGDFTDLKVTIKVDPENNAIIIRDTGIGMTKDEMISYLGTIGKSGTSEYASNLQKENKEKGGSDESNLIGQFGLGFYSAFLVAKDVRVRSVSYKDNKQHVWECSSISTFTIAEDEEGEPLQRGTEITLFLLDEAKEYLSQEKLKNLAQKHSEFLFFPIYMWLTHTVSEEVPLSDEELAAQKEKKATDKPKAEDGVEDAAESEKSEETLPTTKKVDKEVSEFVLLNKVKPVWVRDPKDVPEEEMIAFYRNFIKDTKDTEKPITYTHFKAEGDMEFRAILFVPEKSTFNVFSNAKVETSLSVYVRRVLITNTYVDILPHFLQFLKGLVDSDDLPLNISRENIQETKLIGTIKKKVTRKALEMFQTLADSNPAEYKRFYEKYGANLKLGVIQEESSKSKISDLLRFTTSHNEKEYSSLREYVDRMKPLQKAIYYMCGRDIDEIKKSPFVEKITKRGYEVIYSVDPIDENCIRTLSKYEDHDFADVSKGNLKFGDETEEDKKALEAQQTEFKPLTEWWVKLIADDIDKVVVSERLTTSPCAVVAPEFAYSPYMLKIMKAQMKTEETAWLDFMMKMKKTLEINPQHPVIKQLLTVVRDGGATEDTEMMAKILFQSSMISSGYELKNPADLATQVDLMLRSRLGVAADAEAEVTVRPAPTEEEAATIKAAQEAAAEEAKKNKKSSGSEDGDHRGFSEGADMPEMSSEVDLDGRDEL